MKHHFKFISPSKIKMKNKIPMARRDVRKAVFPDLAERNVPLRKRI